MATISATTNEKVFNIPKWLGLNEHPDGDTRLRMGEASTMVNWRITRDGNLKLRPGLQFVAGLDSQYNVVISPTITKLQDVSADQQIMVYNSVSAMAVPGQITLVGNDAAYIETGTAYLNNVALTGGVLGLPASGWTLENGVLTNTGGSGTAMTIEELKTSLDALEPGEHLFCVIEGVFYALDASSLEAHDDGWYYFGGYKTTAEADAESIAPAVALWSGVIGGKDVLLAACDDGIWSLYDADNDTYAAAFIGTVRTDKGVGFIQFGGIVYILNGYEYYSYDGVNLEVVHGYRPLVAIAIGPLDVDTDNDNVNDTASEAGELTGEYINRLNGERRVWISPDGTNKTFKLPEGGLSSIDWVKDLATGDIIVSGYTSDLTNGTVTFTSVPAKAVNAFEIAYSVSTTYRADVTGNLYAELYSGTTDTRIFIYGDGTNRALYTGMDYDGMPRADYFPDQYEVRVGDSNTPITAMIRHYGSLIAYKPMECWSLEHGIIELANTDLTPAIYCVPVNRDKGNIAPGQVRLVNNSPVTCSGTELYHWTNSSYYTSNLTRDERQARRISDRIQKSIKEIDFKTCIMWDDNDNQEFYIVDKGVALVWNYAVDAWYRYENFPALCMCSFHGDLYIGTKDGKIWRVSDYVVGDNGAAINAMWESGAMSFGADHLRKYSSVLWIGLKPVAGTSVDACVVTDRKNTFSEKNVSAEKAKIAGQPFMVKTKIKAKKFVFYRLQLSVNKRMLPVTVTNASIRVRFTGDAK